MEKQPQEKIRTQLTSKWPRLSKGEVEDILSHHDHLGDSLKKHYNLSSVDAKKQAEKFFKSQEAKETGTFG